MTAGPDPFEYDDAAYVLGALSHEGRIAYEEHLQGCARCTARYLTSLRNDAGDDRDS